MNQSKNEGDCPEGFKVFVSKDGEAWGNAVAESKGTRGAHTLVTFEEHNDRYIKIELTEAKDSYWAITEFHATTGDYRFGWTATVSERWNTSRIPNMFDNDLTTDWSSLNTLQVGEWMIVDMKAPQTFNQIILDQITKEDGNHDHPEGFKVYATNDLENWREAINHGKGSNTPQTKVNLAPDQTARYIKIELTESRGAYWAISEFNINLAIKEDYRFGWTMTASHNNGKAHLALDGDIETGWESGPQYGEEWIILDMKEEIQFNIITLDQGTSPGDYPREYEVFVSNDGKSWGNKVKAGEGTMDVTEIVLRVQKARYFKINQIGLGVGGAYWAIHELHVDYDPDITTALVQPGKEDIQVYYSNKQIHLQGVTFPSVLSLYNLLGQKTKSIEVNQNVIPVDLAPGVYIVTLDNGFSSKLLIK
jgi:hypothetical protein